MDEIGDMSLAAQAKVLRALQESRISRVGSDRDIEVNVRVVAATNKNLREEIQKGNFREDLYHRLAVIVVRVPPLREHAGDIPALVEHFIRTIASEYGSAPNCAEIVLIGAPSVYRRATPLSRAAFATAFATASATRGSKAPGMMFSSLRSSSVMRSAMA